MPKILNLIVLCLFFFILYLPGLLSGWARFLHDLIYSKLMKLAGKSLAEIIKAPVNLLVVHTIDTQEPLLLNQLLNLLCKQCLIVSLPSYLLVYHSLSFCKDLSQTFLNRHVRSDQSFEWKLSAAKQPLIYLKVEPILHCCSFFFL